MGERVELWRMKEFIWSRLWTNLVPIRSPVSGSWRNIYDKSLSFGCRSFSKGPGFTL